MPGQYFNNLKSSDDSDLQERRASDAEQLVTQNEPDLHKQKYLLGMSFKNPMSSLWDCLSESISLSLKSLCPAGGDVPRYKVNCRRKEKQWQ